MAEIKDIHPVAYLEQYIRDNPTYSSPLFRYDLGIGSLKLPFADLNGSLSKHGYPTKLFPVQYGTTLKATWTRGVELTGQFNSQPIKEGSSPSVYEITFGQEPNPAYHPIYNCRGVPINTDSNWLVEIARDMQRLMSDQAEITPHKDRGRNVNYLEIHIPTSDKIQTSTISFFPSQGHDLIDPIHHWHLRTHLPLEEQIAKYVLISQALLKSLPGNGDVQLNHQATLDLIDLTLKECPPYENLSERLIA